MKIIIKTGNVHDWFGLLHKGVVFQGRVGISLAEYLNNELGLSPDYINSRVQTIFLDGRPVDDLESARIRDGATLALAGAMPGLVGACMRVNSPFAGFRSSITYSNAGNEIRKKYGEVVLKLFNMITEEVGADFLARGVMVEARRVAGMFENEAVAAGVESVEVGGKIVGRRELNEILEEGGIVSLTVV